VLRERPDIALSACSIYCLHTDSLIRLSSKYTADELKEGVVKQHGSNCQVKQRLRVPSHWSWNIHCKYLVRFYSYSYSSSSKGKAVPVCRHYAKKDVWRRWGKAPLILNLGTKWSWEVRVMVRPLYRRRKRQWYAIDMRSVGLQSQSGGGVKRKISAPSSNQISTVQVRW